MREKGVAFPLPYSWHLWDEKIRKVEEGCGTLISYIDTIYFI